MRGEDGTPQSRIGFLCTACTDCGIIGHPHQAGSDCAYCGRGVYLHHGYFDLMLCPECIGKRFGCKTCYCKGVLASPREDITHEQAAAIWEEWREARARPPREPEPIHHQELKREWVGKRRARKGRFARL